MRLVELTEKEIVRMIEETDEACAVFMYTPFCGTCKWSERMLEIVKHLHPDVRLYKCNLNYTPALTREWQISSVPCLVVIRRKVYAMKSVVDLLEVLQPVIHDDQKEEDGHI